MKALNSQGPPRHAAQELKSLLDEFGLICCGWHTPFNLVQEDTLAETIEIQQDFGKPLRHYSRDTGRAPSIASRLVEISRLF